VPPHTPSLDALRGAAQRLDERWQLSERSVRATREIALILTAVLLVGAGAATAEPAAPAPQRVAAATTATPSPTPAAVAKPLADRAVTLVAPQPAPQPPAAKPKPAAKPAGPPAPPKAPRWLPTGTGMWLHEWHRSQSGNARDVVARSQRSGFTHLYVQTGSTRKGWIGDEVLSELLPATKGTGIAVIAWDFPKLIDPEADARRMAKAAWFTPPGSPSVAAVAPDVETSAEGTRLSKDAVTRYYRELRKRLPASTAILATVPWPSEKRTGWYPYAETAPWSDAFVPMAYWYNRSPVAVTETSMTWLKRFGKPVMPVGQGYDGRLDAPYLAKDPNLAGSVTRFIDTARKHGAQSISLWSWQTTDGAPWTSLKKAAGTLGPKPAPKPAGKPRPQLQPGEGAQAEKKAKGVAPGRQHKRQGKRDQHG
jgi:hypothetical protein